MGGQAFTDAWGGAGVCWGRGLLGGLRRCWDWKGVRVGSREWRKGWVEPRTGWGRCGWCRGLPAGPSSGAFVISIPSSSLPASQGLSPKSLHP